MPLNLDKATIVATAPVIECMVSQGIVNLQKATIVQIDRPLTVQEAAEWIREGLIQPADGGVE